MGNVIKRRLERMLAGNQKVNKTALQFKASWNEVSKTLNNYGGSIKKDKIRRKKNG